MFPSRDGREERRRWIIAQLHKAHGPYQHNAQISRSSIYFSSSTQTFTFACSTTQQVFCDKQRIQVYNNLTLVHLVCFCPLKEHRGSWPRRIFCVCTPITPLELYVTCGSHLRGGILLSGGHARNNLQAEAPVAYPVEYAPWQERLIVEHHQIWCRPSAHSVYFRSFLTKTFGGSGESST